MKKIQSVTGELVQLSDETFDWLFLDEPDTDLSMLNLDIEGPWQQSVGL